RLALVEDVRAGGNDEQQDEPAHVGLERPTSASPRGTGVGRSFSRTRNGHPVAPIRTLRLAANAQRLLRCPEGTPSATYATDADTDQRPLSGCSTPNLTELLGHPNNGLPRRRTRGQGVATTELLLLGAIAGSA